MKANIKEIRKKCEKIFTMRGVSLKNARIIVDDYVEGELLGKASHGLLAFVSGVYDVKELVNKTDETKIKIEKNNKTYALINGNEQAGQLVADIVHKLLVKKVKQYGIAIVGTYNTRNILRPGTHAEMLARKNLIGLVFHNGGGPLVAPFGGIDPIISTDPIGYAIPTTKLPIVADMAISERAWGEIGVSKLRKSNLSKNAFLDKQGNFTLDPDKAYSAVTFGEYKGYALGIFSEILSGSLVGSGIGLTKLASQKKHHNKRQFDKTMRGALYLAIDPSIFVDINEFKKENTKLVNQLKKSRKRKGIKEIRVPGEYAYTRKKLCLKRGWFDVDKNIIYKIDALLKI